MDSVRRILMLDTIGTWRVNTHFFHGNIWTHNWPAPNASGFIAQLVEHRTGNREVTGSNPVEVLNFFQAYLRTCINCVHCDDHFFSFVSFPQFIYDLFHISLTLILPSVGRGGWVVTAAMVAKSTHIPGSFLSGNFSHAMLSGHE